MLQAAEYWNSKPRSTLVALVALYLYINKKNMNRKVIYLKDINLEETKNLVSKMFDCSWVKWLHEGTKPANNNFENVKRCSRNNIAYSLCKVFKFERMLFC